MKRWSMLLAGLWLAFAARAEPSFDYRLEAVPVAREVGVFLGRSEEFSRGNGGNIVNTGFIVTAAGLVVIDTGPSRRYGEQMRAAMARIDPGPVLQVFNTHHHPDHFLGNQAFAGLPIAALAATRDGIVRDGNAFAENLYRLSGDWMGGTEVLAPTATIGGGRLHLGGRSLRLLSLAGHTGADLAIYDESSGVLFAGDLVFNERAPTTPHAHLGRWLAALDVLEAVTREPGFAALVPGHGPVARDAEPIRRTRAWLLWLRRSMAVAAETGLDMNELLRQPLPPEFAGMAVAASEYRRSVGHLFPAAEEEALAHGH